MTESENSMLSCADVMKLANWTRISQEELRWHAPEASHQSLAELLNTDVQVHEFLSADGKSPIQVVICRDGGLISYNLQSDKWLHTLQMQKDFRLRVFELNLVPIIELGEFLNQGGQDDPG